MLTEGSPWGREGGGSRTGVVGRHIDFPGTRSWAAVGASRRSGNGGAEAAVGRGQVREVSPVEDVDEWSFRCQEGGSWDQWFGHGQHLEVDKRSLGRE